jgi:hypothetical protein
MLELLLQYRPPRWEDLDQITTKGGERRIPIVHYAIETKQYRLLRLLLLHGCPTPRVLFVAIHEPAMFRVLVEHCDPNERNEDGAPLSYAFCRASQARLLKEAMVRGMDIEATYQGRTALWYHWFSRNIAFTKTLLRAGANVNTQCGGRTLLEATMANTRHVQPVRFLLDHGARLPANIASATPQLRPWLFKVALRVVLLSTNIPVDVVKTCF